MMVNLLHPGVQGMMNDTLVASEARGVLSLTEERAMPWTEGGHGMQRSRVCQSTRENDVDITYQGRLEGNQA